MIAQANEMWYYMTLFVDMAMRFYKKVMLSEPGDLIYNNYN